MTPFACIAAQTRICSQYKGAILNVDNASTKSQSEREFKLQLTVFHSIFAGYHVCHVLSCTVLTAEYVVVLFDKWCLCSGFPVD